MNAFLPAQGEPKNNNISLLQFLPASSREKKKRTEELLPAAAVGGGGGLRYSEQYRVVIRYLKQ